MAVTQNSKITKVFSVHPQSGPHTTHSFPHASLSLVAYTRRRVLYRDGHGPHETTGVARSVHAPEVDAFDLYDLEKMCSILCDALHVSTDEDGLYDLASRLHTCVVVTKSLNLCAEFEVVRKSVLAVGPAEEEGTCPICLDGFSGSVTRTHCSHCFHVSCLVTWLEAKSSCPLCRTHL